MTLSEFRAWFDGFTENFEKTSSGDRMPTQKQWARICRKVKDLNNVATTYPVFIERYIPQVPTFWVIPPTTTRGHSGSVWSSTDAFNHLGRAEASSLGA